MAPLSTGPSASIKDATIGVKQNPKFQGACKVYNHHHVAGILPRWRQDRWNYRLQHQIICPLWGEQRVEKLLGIHWMHVTLLKRHRSLNTRQNPGYLKYHDRGYMYFPDPAFLSFLHNIDTTLKTVINIDGLQQEGDNLIKVRIFLCLCKLFVSLKGCTSEDSKRWNRDVPGCASCGVAFWHLHTQQRCHQQCMTHLLGKLSIQEFKSSCLQWSKNLQLKRG